MLERRLITADRMMLAHVYLKRALSCRVTRTRTTAYLHSRGGLRFWIGPDEAQ